MALLIANKLLSSPMSIATIAACSSRINVWKVFSSSMASSAPQPPEVDSTRVAPASTQSSTATANPAEARVAFTFDEPLEPSTFFFDDPLSQGVMSDEERQHITAEELAEKMAAKIEAARMAERLEQRVRSGGFVASADAVPSPEAAGLYGGPGTAAMADMVDVVAGAFVGEKSRVGKAVEDLSHGTAGMPRVMKRPAAPKTYTDDVDQDVLDYCLKNRARGL